MRLLQFLLLLAVVVLPAALIAPHWLREVWVAYAACIVAALAYIALETWRARKLMSTITLDPSQPTASPRLGGIWQDIWDRIEKKTRLQQRQVSMARSRLDEFLHAMEQSPIGVIMLSDDNRMVWANGMAASHFGLDLEHDIEQIITNLIRNPYFTQYLTKPQQPGELVIDGISPNTKLAVHIHDYATLDAQDRHRLVISRDVSSLAQAEAMRRDFVANVSHEIATPLTVLSGFIETMQNMPPDAASQQSMLALMSRQAARMQGLLKDLLMLSKLEASPPPDSHIRVAMDELLTQCEDDAKQFDESLGLTHEITFINQAPGLHMSGSHKELLSAVNNLVHNAIRYTPDGGEIQVVWDMNPQGIGLFSVQDNGPGIAPEHIPRLTERFYRVDDSRSRDTGGTGLGLSIVKHIAIRHNAHLRIESEQGKGSLFELQFPAHRLRNATQTARSDFAPLH